MLDELHVKNIALIREASLEFSNGLTVLTGETGTGKTALLSALRLISGQRADSGAVSDGADEASVQARILVDGEERIISRRVTAAGRSRCSLDGEMATVGQLAQAADSIHIHNQHEQVALLQPTSQLAWLDASVDGAPKAAYEEALACYQEAAARLAEIKSASEANASMLDYCTFVDSQISAVDPQEGELEQLEAELPRMQHAQGLANAAATALQALQADGGAADSLYEAQSTLERLSGIDTELDDLAVRIDQAQAEVADLSRELRVYRDSIQHDPYALEQTLTRLDALSGLMKRYGPSMEQVFATWQQAKDVVDQSEDGDDAVNRAQRKLDEARTQLEAAADVLTVARKEGAGSLCGQLSDALAGLAMPQATFSFSFEELPLSQWTKSGPSKTELLYSPAASASLRPLSKIASGGELSRILLAMECLNARSEDAASRTIVFDEVDAGIGGVAGQAVASRIKELSQRCQVIVVTHLPQVAAFADAHYVVERDHAVDCGTTVRPVEGEERVSEVARMLAGMDDATALDHARKLIGEAAGAL